MASLAGQRGVAEIQGRSRRHERRGAFAAFPTRRKGEHIRCDFLLNGLSVARDLVSVCAVWARTARGRRADVARWGKGRAPREMRGLGCSVVKIRELMSHFRKPWHDIWAVAIVKQLRERTLRFLGL